MKILHVVPSYKPAYVYGGTIESIARLCEGLANAGHEVRVFTTTANGKEELDVLPNSEHDVDGVQVVYFKRIFKDPFYISPALWKQLRRECREYDVVHVHSWWNMLVMVAALICKRQKVKLVISPHGMMSHYILSNSKTFLKYLGHFALGKRLLKYSRYHATAEQEAAECERFIPGWKGFMVPNIVWLPALHMARPVNPRFTILFLSRIHPKKGIELLMEAVSSMPGKPLLKIAGTGEEKYLQQLKRKARALNMEAGIEWLGWQDREEKFTQMMQADLFALTSYNENFGNVVIEALHAGTPVLVSEDTGLSGFVMEHGLGWVCKEEVTDIRAKLEVAINDAPERERITRKAPGLVSGWFAEEHLVPEYLRHYQ